MARNIYDNEEFFAAYSRLERSLQGLDGAPEWSVLRAMLPELRRRKALDLGCGFGWFCRWAYERGAAEVLGIDVSEKMLARAKAMTTNRGISYIRADLENLALPVAVFDLVYSSLAFHYVERLDALIATVHAALVPGGSLVFSVEHPMTTASAGADWILNAGRRVWPVAGYFDEGSRSTDWLAKGVIKQHRTVATYVNTLLRHGFGLSGFEEWSPSEAQVRMRPEWAPERERPFFLLVAAAR
ncbi:MAG: class I SAM-dependent methyltransferase [Candidatus Binataceae bacterium]